MCKLVVTIHALCAHFPALEGEGGQLNLWIFQVSLPQFHRQYWTVFWKEKEVPCETLVYMCTTI